MTGAAPGPETPVQTSPAPRLGPLIPEGGPVSNAALASAGAPRPTPGGPIRSCWAGDFAPLTLRGAGDSDGGAYEVTRGDPGAGSGLLMADGSGEGAGNSVLLLGRDQGGIRCCSRSEGGGSSH